jgi:hypothetical protein
VHPVASATPLFAKFVPANFFLFPTVKKELAGLTLTKETLKKEREGAMTTLTTADFTAAFQ